MEVDGNRTWFEDCGEGDVIVLHGGLTDADDFSGNLDRLADRYRVVMPDRDDSHAAYVQHFLYKSSCAYGPLMTDHPDAGPGRIRDSAVLRALANPARPRLIDSLTAHGPATVSMLAERLGMAVGSASHHLQALARAGLVEEAPELASDARQHWWRAVPGGYRWSSSDFRDDPGARAASAAAELQALDRQYERARRWIETQHERPPWAEVAFVHQAWIRLTPAETAELAGELATLYQRYRALAERDEDNPDRENVLLHTRGFPAEV